MFPAQVSDMCCEAMRNMFREDKLGYASLAAVKVLSGMIKGRHFNVRPEVSLGGEPPLRYTHLPPVSTSRHIMLPCGFT